MTVSSSSRSLSDFRAYWRSLSREGGRSLWAAVALLVLIGLLEGFGLLLLVPVLRAIGIGFESGADESLIRVLVPLIFIKAAQAMLRAVSGTVNLKLETKLVCSLRERFYRAMIHADWLTLTRLRSSDLTQALIVEIPTIGNATHQLLMLLSVAFIALVQTAIALTLSPLTTLVALASGFVIALGLGHLRNRSRQVGELGHGKRAEMAAAVNEHLAGMKVAKSHGREGQHFAHFQRAMHDIVQHTLRLHRLGTFMTVWLEIGAVLALSGFVYFAVGRVDAARLLVLVFIFTRLLSHSTMLQNLWHHIVQSLPAFSATERLREDLVAAAEPAAAAAPQPLVLRDGVRFERVSFNYHGGTGTHALHALELVVPARQVTAICGPSGAGKSTLADVLLGLLRPTDGRVLVDRTELAGSLLHEWRRSIGYVSQETFLFHDTVRANLLWARPGATEAELREALRTAAAEGFVDRLPRGLDTAVGDRGVRLSGGERQRLALARALLRRPTLLVLDEATSALDPQNERVVQDAIEKLHGELTIVLIAHRLSTLRMADHIVLLSDGAVVEAGTWSELHARETGEFQRFAAMAGPAI